MNSGPTAERVYDTVKRRILTGSYRPGERIEVAALAEALDSSVTPVRDALHLLVGERLVDTRTGDGFHLRQIDVPGLVDLYEWNRQVLLQALRSSRAGTDPPAQDSGGDDAGTMTGRLFACIGMCSGNIEHVRQLQSINDRLHAVRNAESVILRDWREELAALRHELEREDAPAVRRLIGAYHRRRGRIASELVRALSRRKRGS
jgi:DNA-binding GntR family transcriptional regulator